MHYDVSNWIPRQVRGSEPPRLIVHVSRQGRLSTGKEFDSSRKRGQPFDFVSESAVCRMFLCFRCKSAPTRLICCAGDADSHPRFARAVGRGQVIKGWEQGLLDMCPGEKRTLTIPSDLGYGSRGVGPIPGGASFLSIRLRSLRLTSIRL